MPLVLLSYYVRKIHSPSFTHHFYTRNFNFQFYFFFLLPVELLLACLDSLSAAADKGNNSAEAAPKMQRAAAARFNIQRRQLSIIFSSIQEEEKEILLSCVNDPIHIGIALIFICHIIVIIDSLLHLFKCIDCVNR